MRTGRFVAALVCGVLVVSQVYGADKAAPAEWPGWRGANRDGKSPDKNLLKAWPAGGPKQLWKRDGIGAGYSSATVAGGMVFVTGQNGGRLHLSALDMEGKPKWSEAVGPAFTKSYAGARSTPTYSDGMVYVESGMGVVACYEAKGGRRRWGGILSQLGGRVPGWGFSESVLVTDKLAVVTPGGLSCMVAMDKKNGKVVWRSAGFGPAHYSSPISAEFKGASMIINGTGSGLIAVNAKTGKTLWTSSFSAGNTANCPTPAYSDGYVFWANGYGKGGICLKLEVSGDRIKATEAWRTKDMVSHHGGYVIVDGYIYGNNGGSWSCIELKTGQTKWRARGVGKGSICYADGMLYLFGEGGGRAMLAKASPDGLTAAGQFSIKGNGPSWAHPVVIGGKLYLRYDQTLYCYDVRAEAEAKAE